LHERFDRIKELDPNIILTCINTGETNEVLIRRYMSAMYMALFNYWAAKEYNNGKNRHRVGKSGEDDDFKQTELEESMLGIGVHREIKTLSIYRNACDHRIENPARGIRPPAGIKNDNVPINNNSLKKVFLSFNTLLDQLK
jgi:hypothetical protein